SRTSLRGRRCTSRRSRGGASWSRCSADPSSREPRTDPAAVSGYPASWRAMPLGDLVSHVTDGVEPHEATHLPYVGLEHIAAREMTLTRWGAAESVRSRKTLFQPGDILYGKLRPYLDKVVEADTDGICSTDILVLRPNRHIVPYFVVS